MRQVPDVEGYLRSRVLKDTNPTNTGVVMNPIYGPLLEAEIAYRHARISSDFAAASRWSDRLHRATRHLRRAGTPATTAAPMVTRRQPVRRAAAH